MEQNRDYSNLQKLREEIEELEEKETQKRRVVNRKKNKADHLEKKRTIKPQAVPYMVPLAYDAIMRLDSKIKEANSAETRKKEPLPIWHKYLLSIEEAAEYFGIGEKRLRRIAADNIGEDFIMEIGSQIRIKRELFEQYLNSSGTI